MVLLLRNDLVFWVDVGIVYFPEVLVRLDILILWDLTITSQLQPKPHNPQISTPVTSRNHMPS